MTTTLSHLLGRESSEISGTAASSDSGRTAAERNYACEQDDSVVKHATILDIDPLSRLPKDGMAFRKPTIDSLLKHGPSRIMNEIKGHRTSIRWVHLRSNCMSWIEGLMEKVCEERHIPTQDNNSQRPSTPAKINPLLRKDLWAHLFHGKASDQIQTRFMGPTCTPFSIDLEDEQSDSTSDSTKGPRNNLVLYLPYLNWELAQSWKQRQELIREVGEGREIHAQADSELIKKYLHHDASPLHDRRTLHQAYYHDFGMTRPLPKYDQVMQRFTAEMTSESEAKLLVVDQLWLWIIKGKGPNEQDSDEPMPDLVITAFPGRFNGCYDSADVYHGIIEHLERGLEPSLRSANDLAAVIVEHCTGVFFQRQLEADKWFLEFYAAAIGVIRDKQKAAFTRFCYTSQELEELQINQTSLIEVSRKLEDAAFSISVETTLFSQIKDIIDELECIDYILGRQDDMVRALTRTQKSRSLRTVSDIVKERRNTWAGIAQTAKIAYNEIQAQMDLKQKQSSLAEARTNRYQVEDSARHGRIMLLFTVVTIIFLPMSFLATWFGMNLKEEDNGQLTLGLIAAVVFPISILIAVGALVFAFSQRLRDWLASCIERIIDGTLGLLGIHGSRSTTMSMHSGLQRDRERPRRFDVRLRRLTETGLEDDINGRRHSEDQIV